MVRLTQLANSGTSSDTISVFYSGDERPTQERSSAAWAADAAVSHERALAAVQHLRAKHSALGELFGDAVEVAVVGPVEAIVDHMQDMRNAFMNARDHLRRQRDASEDSNAGLIDQITELEASETDLLDQVGLLVDLVERNYRRAGKTVPEFVANIANQLRG